MCVQAEKMLKQAYKAAEISYRKSQTTQHQNAMQEALHREFLDLSVRIDL